MIYRVYMYLMCVDTNLGLLRSWLYVCHTGQHYQVMININRVEVIVHDCIACVIVRGWKYFDMNIWMRVFIVRQETVNLSRSVKAMITPFSPSILAPDPEINKINILTTCPVYSFRVAIIHHVVSSFNFLFLFLFDIPHTTSTVFT